MRGKRISLLAIIFIMSFITLFNLNLIGNSKVVVNEVNRIAYNSGNSDGYEVQQVKMLGINLKVRGEYDEKIKSTPITCKVKVDRMTRLIYIDGEEVLGYKYIVYKKPAGTLMQPTKKGYTFVQWTNADGEVIDENSIISSTEDYPIYANWNIIVSQLEVQPNGGTWEDSVGDQSFSMEYSARKDIEDPTRVGYTFDKWELTGADSTLEAKVFTMGTEDSTLKAIWNANKYTLTVDPNGGIYNGTTELTKTTIEYDSITTIPNPTRRGYTFTGWTVSAGELNGDKFFMNHTGDVTLTANWTINSYKYIVYHSQQSVDGSTYNKVADDTETGERNFGTVISPNVKSYTGFTSPSRQNMTIQDDTDPPVKNIIDYKYARNRYTLTVNPNGGTWNGTTANSNIPLYYQQTRSIPNPTRTGYTFVNWAKTNNDSTLVDQVFKMGLAHTTLTANWNAKTYTLTYDVNTGNPISLTSKTIKYDQAYGTLPTPTKTGYRFLGWYTARTGGSPVTASTIHKQESNVTIYAHWSNNPPVINSISIRYANNNSTSNGLLQNGYERITITIRTTDTEDIYPSYVNLNCTSGKICQTGSIRRVSYSSGVATYEITARNYGAGTFTVTARDSAGLTTTSSPQIMYVYGPGGALSDTVRYTNTDYDSGWFEVLDSCYISYFSFSVQFDWGHYNSAANDSMTVYGMTESGQEVILFQYRGNMEGDLHISNTNVLNSYNSQSYGKIRQIRFHTYSPHSGCTPAAIIKYEIQYNFDYNLINSTYRPRY